MKKILSALLVFVAITTSSCTADTSNENTELSGTSYSTSDSITDNETVFTPTTVAPTSDEVTSPPLIIVTKNIESDVVLVAGACEESSVISVKGEYTEPFDITSDGGSFVFAVTLEDRRSDTLSVTATVSGKDESDAARVDAKYIRGAKNREIFITNDSRICQNSDLGDLYHTNLFNENELLLIKSLAKKRVQKAKEKSGKDIEIIYVIVPNSTAIYSEGVPDEMKENIVSDNSSIKQAKEALSGIDGVTVIDMTDILSSHKDEKIYYNLDTHWTELGAYYAYVEIMNVVAKKFPNASAHPLSDYDIKNVTLNYTDMMTYADIENMGVFENAPFLMSRYTPLSPYDKAKKEEAYIWNFTNEFFDDKTSTTEIDDPSLPRGIFIFDSYGLNAIQLIAEHFSSLTCQPIWTYALDYDIVEEKTPDYVIQLISERTTEKLLLSE